MNKMIFSLFVTALLLSGCGGGGSSSTTTSTTSDTNTSTDTDSSDDTAKTFAYETQKTIALNITVTKAGVTDDQKQILLYENTKSETIVDNGNEVGELVTYDNLLLSGTMDNKSFSANLTLGRHIHALWVVIPAIEYAKYVAIDEDNTLTIKAKRSQKRTQEVSFGKNSVNLTISN